MVKKKIISLTLAALMIFTMLPTAVFADDSQDSGLTDAVPISAPVSAFPDSENHWAEADINRWASYGVLNGRLNGFAPDENIKRGEFFKVLDTIFAYQKTAENPFTDLSSSNWYYAHALKLVAAGVLKGDGGKVNGENNITREEAFALIARVFQITANESGLGKFLDEDAVASWFTGEVGGLAAAGLIEGSNGLLRPKDSLTRAETVRIINNIIQGYIYEAGTYEEDIDGRALVNAEGVILKGITVSGDLYITQGVGSGDVTLDNTTVEGTIYVQGGGVNTIKIINGSSVGKINVNVLNGAVRILLDNVELTPEKAKELGIEVVIEGASDDVILTGVFGEVTVGGATVTFTDAKVDTVVAIGADSEIITSGKTVINSIEVIDVAEGTSVKLGTGTSVGNIVVEADSFTLSGTGEVTGIVRIASGEGSSVTVVGAKVEVGAEAGAVTTPTGTIDPGKSGTVSSGGTGGGTSGGGSGDPGTSVVAVTGVSLTATTEVYVGSTTTLTATVSPAGATNKNVTWTSSKNAVATVEGGVVTGVTAGTANITVTTADGSFEATCLVTVHTAPDAVELTDIAIIASPSKLNYLVGEELDLTGLVVAANYSDGSQVILDNEDLDVDGFDSTEAEAGQEITITYEEQKATFEVNIYIYTITTGTLVSIGTIELTFVNGTSKEAIIAALPSTVVITLTEDSAKTLAEVVWETSALESYNPANPEEVNLAFEGTVTLPENISANNVNLTTSCLATVLAKTYTVTFNYQTLEFPNEYQTVSHGNNATKPVTGTTRTGYTFDGWFAAPTGGEEIDDFGEVDITANVTFYAQWTAKTYTVIFDVDDGSAVAEQADIPYGGKVAVPTAPTKDGYVFGGWYTDGTIFENAYNFNTPVTEAITLYAKWNDSAVLTALVAAFAALEDVDQPLTEADYLAAVALIEAADEAIAAFEAAYTDADVTEFVDSSKYEEVEEMLESYLFAAEIAESFVAYYHDDDEIIGPMPLATVTDISIDDIAEVALEYSLTVVFPEAILTSVDGSEGLGAVAIKLPTAMIANLASTEKFSIVVGDDHTNESTINSIDVVYVDGETYKIVGSGSNYGDGGYMFCILPASYTVGTDTDIGGYLVIFLDNDENDNDEFTVTITGDDETVIVLHITVEAIDTVEP
jgi:uncharacterized repeat protein (TIGR02543 family)